MASFLLLLLLIIPFLIKWKSSDFILSEKSYGFFLIWLSRLLTAFIINSFLYYWFDLNSIYVMYFFIGYFVLCLIKEIKLYVRTKKTVLL